ncbi:MAG TPA: hypothetical protein VLK84_21420 [Longimicrobium sp.]|nr:hypothetical protein [Longimicrobium sp.]
MYRSCIFCSADLKANDALERFPVGRSIAFDGEKGRLWAVCAKCARWNLAPIEERWEAIEDAERLFRDCRMRAQRENIGLAKLRDGTRLVRIGAAPAGELALWRYGSQLARRRARWVRTRLLLPATALAGVAAYAVSPVFVPVMGLMNLAPALAELRRYRRAGRVAHRVPAEAAPGGRELYLRWRDLARMQTGLDAQGEPELVFRSDESWLAHGSPVRLRGTQARQVLSKALLGINRTGALPGDVDEALKMITEAGGADGFVRRVAADGWALGRDDVNLGEALPTFRAMGRAMNPFAESRPARPSIPVPWRQLYAHPSRAIALEMAVHEESERRALEGELAGLEEAWRQAEEIAAIADRLPDDLPPGT